MTKIPDTGGGGNPSSPEADAEFIGLAPGGTSPDTLESFRDHASYLFDASYDPESATVNTWTFVALANGLFYKGRYKKETLEAFADELVERLRSPMAADWSDPLLNALYIVAGEFLGLMQQVHRKRIVERYETNNSLGREAA